MASLLLLGSSDHLSPFIAAIPADHSIHTVASETHALGERAPNVLASLSDLPVDIDCIVDLTIDRAAKERTLEALRGKIAPGAIVFTNAVTMTATDAAARLGGISPVVGIGYLPANFEGSSLLEASLALGTSSGDGERAISLLRELTSKEIEVVGDRVGLVSARTLAMIINEGAFALMEGVASVEDIDVAMKLGTNYPEGPLRWADRIGPDAVLHILQALHDEYQEERYRPCVLLKQLARAGMGFGENAE